MGRCVVAPYLITTTAQDGAACSVLDIGGVLFFGTAPHMCWPKTPAPTVVVLANWQFVFQTLRAVLSMTLQGSLVVSTALSHHQCAYEPPDIYVASL